jgi:hypothetical protein
MTHRHDWPGLDPDPRHVDPEPVRRPQPDDAPSPGHVVLALTALVLALLIVVGIYANLSAPR